MILDELVLHDFGVYAGRQALTLTPKSAEQPIVLVGGLNGGGKTTILDALQLCLFGQAAPGASRASGSYEQYLRRCIHRGASASEAAVELKFRQTSEGQEHAYRLHRSWRATRDGGCKETFEVLRDGVIDRLATENWAEQVEDFMPARIANLFLFDGEKVERYADLEDAPALIGAAIQNLLGLDMVERLSADITLLERRKRSEDKTAPPSSVDEVQDKISALEAQRATLHAEAASLRNRLDRAKAKHEQIAARYRREGGELYERRMSLEREAADGALSVTNVERDLREIAGGAAPLMLVADLVAQAHQRAAGEAEAARSREMAQALEEEHAAILDLPALRSLAGVERASVTDALHQRRASHLAAAAQPMHLNLSREDHAALAALAGTELGDLRRTIKSTLRQSRRAAQAHGAAQAALAAAPSEDRLADVVAARTAAQNGMAVLEAEQRRRETDLATIDRELQQLRDREARLAEAALRARFEHEDVQRLLTHSSRVKETLARFRQAVVARHVARIERLVLESFQGLVRKPQLVSDLRIDPVTFRLELAGTDGQPLSPERLSAGERQLLAVAILWGLAKASGRALPTVIDTPLGRLDSHHRTRLVERYFPHASHQVVLLSTDEEIMGAYYEALAPAIGRTYHLAFDQALGRTTVEGGYFASKVLQDVA